MIIMGVDHAIAFPNLFTYYEQYMAKSIFYIIITTTYIRDGLRNGRL
jgi:hypothetical protein